MPSHQPDVWTKATEEDCLRALIALGCLPSRKTDQPEMDTAAYFVGLDGVTRYGLANAVKAILQASLGHGFFPSPPELRMQCEEAMQEHYRAAERERRQRAIAEENARFGLVVRSAEARERVSAIYSKFCREWEATKANERMSRGAS